MISFTNMSRGRKTIPKKFQKINKTFIKRLQKEEHKSFIPNLVVFPRKFSFYSKDAEEDVVLMIRKHWIAFVPNIMFTILLLLFPLVLLYLSSRTQFFGSYKIYIGVLILCLGLATNLIVTTILKWYYTLYIVTDNRFVIVRMENALFHSYGETSLSKIQDVTHRTSGVISVLFDIGEVDIDTAGHEVDFQLKEIPRPREIQDVIMDLIQMRKEGRL
jgi:membrane protein YdbS with pleckstrin-like domain